jgi:hypothetical protein
MSTALAAYAARCHDILKAEPGPEGRAKVCGVVKDMLADPGFIAEHLPADGPERKILYQDPELGFCILGHVYQGAKDSPPHDHGPTWAIYGQAMGTTIMTDWEAVEPASEGKPGTARPVRHYELTPGMAYHYEPGALHSPRRDGPTRLIRMEGVDVSKIRRHAYRPAAEATA